MEPRNSFNSAISKTLDWYLNNRKWCEKVAKNSNYNGKRIGILNSNNQSIIYKVIKEKDIVIFGKKLDNCKNFIRNFHNSKNQIIS